MTRRLRWFIGVLFPRLALRIVKRRYAELAYRFGMDGSMIELMSDEEFEIGLENFAYAVRCFGIGLEELEQER